MYKGINQYHVVMEVDPRIPAEPRRAEEYLRPLHHRPGRCRSAPSRITSLRRRRWPSPTRASFPPSPSPSILAPNVPLGDAVTAVQNVERTIGLARHHSSGLSGHGAGLPGLAGHRALSDPGGAGHRLHRAGNSLRELHPPHHDSLHACPRPASAPCWRCWSPTPSSSIIALIGIILLIGIVKKNAILMIDFAIEAERNEGNSPEDSIYQACLLRFRPIMMTTMAAMFGGIPIAVGRRKRLGVAPPAGHRHRRRA